MKEKPLTYGVIPSFILLKYLFIQLVFFEVFLSHVDQDQTHIDA